MARNPDRASRRERAESHRGGRAPGRWEVVAPEELKRFRGARGLSRAKLAQLVGVSATSIQNWESGRVASLKIQRRLRALIDGEPVLGVSPSDGCQDPACRARQALVRTTGSIVAAYVETQRGVQPAELPALVRSVRAALAD